MKAAVVREFGKPLVIEEMFPLACSGEELLEFISRSKPHADGWISFYWGQTIEECEARGDIGAALTAALLKQFRAGGPVVAATKAGETSTK